MSLAIPSQRGAKARRGAPSSPTGNRRVDHGDDRRPGAERRRRARLVDRDGLRGAAGADHNRRDRAVVMERHRPARQQHHCRLGLSDRKLCLVDRHRQCGHAHLRVAAADKAGWRASINRFAEAMTLFAVSIAGLFPILHLGRPQYFYWLAPYPNTMTLWPQWRSALVWDFWAILSYLLFSIIFFYVGLAPRSRRLSRPIEVAPRTPDLRRFRARLARIGAPMAAAQYVLRDDGGDRGSAGLLGAFDRRPRFRGEPDARLAGDDLPALFRSRRDVLRIRHGGPARRRDPLGLWLPERADRSGISRRWRSSSWQAR